MKYHLIYKTSRDEFEESVNLALANGAQLIGGPSIGTYRNGESFFYQAYLKREYDV